MTKREEIRLSLLNTEFTDDDIDRSDIGTFYLTGSGLTKVLNTLHSQGVVIKVDRELPFADPYGTCTAELNALNILIEARYTPVEPLIEETVLVQNQYTV